MVSILGPAAMANSGSLHIQEISTALVCTDLHKDISKAKSDTDTEMLKLWFKNIYTVHWI